MGDLGIGESLVQATVVIVAGELVARQQFLLAFAQNDFVPRDEILRKISTHGLIELAIDSGQIIWTDVFGGINAKATEAKAHEIQQVLRDSFLNILEPSVEIRQAHEPSIADLGGAVVVLDAAFAMEIIWSKRHSRKLDAWTLACVLVSFVGVRLCEIWCS